MIILGLMLCQFRSIHFVVVTILGLVLLCHPQKSVGEPPTLNSSIELSSELRNFMNNMDEIMLDLYGQSEEPRFDYISEHRRPYFESVSSPKEGVQMVPVIPIKLNSNRFMVDSTSAVLSSRRWHDRNVSREFRPREELMLSSKLNSVAVSTRSPAMKLRSGISYSDSDNEIGQAERYAGNYGERIPYSKNKGGADLRYEDSFPDVVEHKKNYKRDRSRSFEKNTKRPRRSVIHLYDMVVCATGCNPLAYKGYGCYCGFMGSGMSVDGIDRCCAMHDYCYHHARCPPLLTYFVPYYWTCAHGTPQCVRDFRGWKGACGTHLCECDKQFAECLRQFPCPRSRAVCMTSPWRLWQNLLMAPASFRIG